MVLQGLPSLKTKRSTSNSMNIVKQYTDLTEIAEDEGNFAKL